jgi:hypothetical protein
MKLMVELMIMFTWNLMFQSNIDKYKIVQLLVGKLIVKKFIWKLLLARLRVYQTALLSLVNF